MSVTGTNISLTLRNVKGSELTYSELDGNQSNLKTGIENHSHDEFAPNLGADDNYVTDAEKAALHSHSNKTALDLVSGTNTGDQDLSGYSLTSHNHSGTYEPANANIQSHISSISNPHSVTATQVGLGNVLNATQEVISAKGQALGYCPLDGSAKVSETYLPDSVLGQVEYKGTWNATTNTPIIPAADSTNKGHYYIVATSGTTLVDGISDWTIGDWIVSNGTTWNKVDNTDSVSSVFGRAGAIVANAGDYTAAQITNTPAGNIAAVTVQAALNELDTEKADKSGKLSQFAATTSAELAGVISDETGSGSLVFATSPSLITPDIGVATGTSFNSITGLATATPLVNGTAAVGTSTKAAKEDHVHGTDTTRAPVASPTFTGTVTLPTTTAIGNVSSTELSYLDGVASAIQPQIDNKQPLDATLTALAGTAVAADQLIFATGADTFSTTSFTSTARSLLDDTTTAAMLTTLGAAADSAVVKLTGDQTVAGAKTFVSSVTTRGLYLQRNRIDNSTIIPDGYNAVIFGDFEIGPDATITCLGNATFTAIG